MFFDASLQLKPPTNSLNQGVSNLPPLMMGEHDGSSNFPHDSHTLKQPTKMGHVE